MGKERTGMFGAWKESVGVAGPTGKRCLPLKVGLASDLRLDRRFWKVKGEIWGLLAYLYTPPDSGR